MKLAAPVWLLLALLLPFRAEADPATDKALQTAENAVEEGLPEIAILQLRKALKEQRPDEDRTRLRLALAEVLLATNDGPGALQELEGVPIEPRVLFARAKALALTGQWKEAEAGFLKVAEDPTRGPEARFYAAEAARMTGGWDRALPVYQKLVDDPIWKVPARRRLAVHAMENDDLGDAEELLEKMGPSDHEGAVLLARLLILKKEYQDALKEVEPLAKDGKGLSPELAAIAATTAAQALKNLNRREEAVSSLLLFIEQNPQNPYLAEVIGELVTLDKEFAQESLARWAADSSMPRKALAALALAKLRYDAWKWTEAIQVLQQFKADPSSPMASEGIRLLLKIQLASANWDEATATVELLEKQAADSEKIELAQIKARIALERGKYQEAGELYRKLSESADVPEEQRLYFRTLSALWNGEEEAFSKSYEEFSARYPASDSRPGLLLERGLFFVQTKDARAVEALTRFVEEFPGDPKSDEARIALADLAYLGASADTKLAEKWLEQVKTESEKADYLRFWIASANPEGDPVPLAKKFVERWPRSPKRPYILFKLGESHYGKGDYVNAQAAFEQLATEFPEHELTGRSNYLAGVSMLRTMNPQALEKAILTLERAAQGDPAVRNMARLAQAEAYVKSGRENEALVVYEDVLKSNPDSVSRAAAYCGKGEMLLAQGKERIPAAMEAFDAVTADPQIDRYWKQESLWRKAKAVEMSGDLDGALLGYYEAVKFGDQIQEHPGGELFWYFKSGFDAARLLEAKKRWPDAIAIYRKLAGLEGARSSEAAERAKRLQLEHYIWEESSQ